MPLPMPARRGRIGPQSSYTKRRRFAMHGEKRWESALVAHQPGLVALPVSRLLGLALVDLALALGDAELDLGDAAIVEVDREGNQGNTLTLHRAEQPVELAPPDQQLPSTPAR